MTSKANLPAMAIIGASVSQFLNVFKGVFIYFWPFLILYLLKDYFVISSKTVGLQNATVISLILSVVLFFCLVAVQICWYEKVITKQNFKYSFDKRSFVTLGYSLVISLFLVIGIVALTMFFGFTSKSGFLSSGFAITLTILGGLFLLSLLVRFCLIFPAIAVNNNKTRIKRSWELTKGYHIKLFFMTFGFIFIIAIPGGISNMVLTKTGLDSTFMFLLIMFFFNTFSLISTLLVTEMVGRLFVFFHVPEKIKEYL